MIDLFLFFIVFSVLTGLSLWIRLSPFQINPKLGVDNWYWLLCAEDVKKQRRLPAKLPYFMLELEEQWYPPLYAGLLALLPMKWLEKYGGMISQLIDILHGLLIFLMVLYAGGNLAVALLSGLSYAVAYLPLSYNTQLQPRGGANLLLTLAVIGLWFYQDTGQLIVLGGVLVLSIALLFLHKMATQMWVVYLLGFGVWAQEWSIPILLPISVICAILISKGFYLNVLKHHWDIVSFWHENIRYLNAHQYYESPRYYKEDFISTALHQPGSRGLVRKFFNLFIYNIFIIILPALLYYALFVRHFNLSFLWELNSLESFLWWWLGLTYLWVFMTTFVPYFTALGAGSYYVYHSFLPLFVLTGLLLSDMPFSVQGWLFVLWGGALFLSGDGYRQYLTRVADAKTGVLPKELIEVLEHLKKLPKDGVFCIPFTLPDSTAYWTRKKVFWGGHGYGFHSMLKPYFPIMRQDVVQTLKEKPLNYVLFRSSYLDSLQDIGLEEGQHITQIYCRGEYELYEVIKENVSEQVA